MVLARFRSRLLGSAVIGAGLLSASSLSALATPAELVIGDTSASGETYNVSGTESWSVVTVGNGNGETGTIIIGPGANLESGQVGSYSTTIGNMTGSVGKVFVQGAGAIWTDISEAINVGQSGSGSIEVSGGGAVSAHALNLGFSNDGSGNVLLSGPGTSFTVTVGVTSGYGVGGSGSMTVLDGAAFEAIGGSYYVESGSTVTVSGEDTSFRIGTLRDGIPDSWPDADGWFSVSAGTVTVSDGAFFEADGLYVQGHATDGPASMIVSGDGTILDAKLLMYIGGNGNGTAGDGELSIVDGATAYASVVSTGSDPGTTGKLLLSGEGTSLTTVPHANFLGNVYAGASGDGTIIVQNGAELTLTNQFRIAYGSGSSGVLVIGAEEGQTAAGAGTVNAANGIVFGDGDGKIVFNHTSDNLLFENTISGAGEIRQLAGTTDIAGDLSDFTGTMSLIGGELTVSGTLGGVTTVGSGGRLSGSGTVASVVAEAGSIVAPGNSPGTLTVVGNYEQQAGSTYLVELVPGSTVSDLILVGGIATILDDAILDVSKYGTGNYATNARYTVLTATGGVVGSYQLAGDAGISTFYRLQAAYDANNVYLEAAQHRSFLDAASTANQRKTASVLQALTSSNTLRMAVAALPDDASARAAFDALSGEIHPTISGVLVEDSSLVRMAVLDRVRAGFGSGNSVSDSEHCLAKTSISADCATVWASGLGATGNRDADANAVGFSNSLVGIVGGIEGAMSENLRAGIFVGYNHSSIDGDRDASGSIKSTTAGVYGGAQLNAVTVRLGAAYSWNDISTHRAVMFGDFGDNLNASYDGATIQGFGEVGYKLDLGGKAVEPFAGLAYVKTRHDGFSENGGPAALTLPSGRFETGFSTLGVHLSGDLPAQSMNTTVNATIAWRHALDEITPSALPAFGDVASFEVFGTTVARDALLVEAGIAAELTPDVSLEFDYLGQFSAGGWQQGGRAGLSVKF